MAELCFREGERVLFIGDSITDCGRRGPAGPLGDGYVSLFVDLVTALHPERSIIWVNKGIGGNRITDLQNRWEDDVIRENPDWLLVKIGINDLHSNLLGMPDPVSPERFRAIYDEILARAKQHTKARVILVTPFYISLDRSPASLRSRVLDLLPSYLQVVEEMSKKHGARLINLHEMFQRQLQFRPPDSFCPEPVHPNRTGHLLIAQTILAALCE
jgi:lysophospholipase L1-like esterase